MDDTSQARPEPPAEDLRWDRILAWRSRLAADDPGHWVQPERQADGVFIMGYVVLSETARSFVAMLYDEQVVTGFDWPGWMEHRGNDLASNPTLVAGASLEDCRRLLCALVRADRFSEGALLGSLEDGLIDTILGRIGALTSTPG